MIAKIGFTVYDDFEQYLKEENDYEYNVALNVLNENLKHLVNKNKLSFTYKGKKVKILLPIEMYDTGNIFGKDDDEVPNWDGVDIPCEVDCDPSEFDSHKLRVSKCPDNFEPRCILW